MLTSKRLLEGIKPRRHALFENGAASFLACHPVATATSSKLSVPGLQAPLRTSLTRLV